jgi:hypothetical protein
VTGRDWTRRKQLIQNFHALKYCDTKLTLTHLSFEHSANTTMIALEENMDHKAWHCRTNVSAQGQATMQIEMETYSESKSAFCSFWCSLLRQMSDLR